MILPVASGSSTNIPFAGWLSTFFAVFLCIPSSFSDPESFLLLALPLTVLLTNFRSEPSSGGADGAKGESLWITASSDFFSIVATTLVDIFVATPIPPADDKSDVARNEMGEAVIGTSQ